MSLTATDLIETARDKYNGTGDTFFDDNFLYRWLTEACNVMARRTNIIEAIDTQNTVADTQEYNYPQYAMSLKRVEYEGGKLQLITFREDDAITLSGQTGDATGTPVFYTDFDRTIYLRPVPSAVGELKVYYYSLHPDLIEGSTVLIPDEYQASLVDFVLANMYAKDKDFNAATFYETKFEKTLQEIIRQKQAKKRADKFASVQSEELLPSTVIGAS